MRQGLVPKIPRALEGLHRALARNPQHATAAEWKPAASRLIEGIDKRMIRIATAPVSPRRAYQYDTLGRPTSRTLARQGATRNDVFTYNDRSELISDVVDGTGLNGWDYDRAAAACSSGVASRPVLFSKEGEDLTVACTYDYMGRRATKVVTENGVITTSHRFLYRGYLQNVVNARKIS